MIRSSLLIIFLLAAFLNPLLAGDWSPSPITQWLSKEPTELTPKVQRDDFSCGYLALASIYESYGLDAEQANLRARLGTNRPAIPFVESSNGTLQQDLFRVLKQDGFESATVDPQNPQDLHELTIHLDGPHYALALVSTAKAGGLHWIVFTDHHNGEITIADSLVQGLHKKPLKELVETSLLRVIALRPGTPDPHGKYGAAHWIGTQEMWFSISPKQRITLIVSTVCIIGLFVILIRILRQKLFNKSRNAKTKSTILPKS